MHSFRRGTTDQRHLPEQDVLERTTTSYRRRLFYLIDEYNVPADLVLNADETAQVWLYFVYSYRSCV